VIFIPATSGDATQLAVADLGFAVASLSTSICVTLVFGQAVRHVLVLLSMTAPASAAATAAAAPSAPSAAGSGSKNSNKIPRLPFAPRVNGKRFVVQRSVSKFKTNFSKVPDRYTLKFVKLVAEEVNARLARIEAGPGLQRILKKLVQSKCLTNVWPFRPAGAAPSAASAPGAAPTIDPHGQTPIAAAAKPAAAAVRK
jgi:hypothetical protein